MPVQILPKINCKIAVREISQFLKREFEKRNKSSAIVGVSGGVDSSLTAKLCQMAGLKVKKVYLPCGKISHNLKGYSLKIDISSVVAKQVRQMAKCALLDKRDKGNVMTRTRMIFQYALARAFNGLVVGTENLSEYYLGYFTLYGDQACDINPIAGLWKTQVIKLAEYLGLPLRVPSAELWEGQTDEKELGFSYEECDPILYLYCIKKMNREKIAKEFDIPENLIYRVIERVKLTQYKREGAAQYGRR